VRDAPTDLLARLTRPDDDDEYVAAAGRRTPGEPRRRRGIGGYAVAVAVVGVLVTVSALQTQAGRSADEQDREALLSRIDAEQADVAAARSRVEDLAVDVEALRDRSVGVNASVDDVEDRLAQLDAVVGAVPVQGPGVRVTLDDSPSGGAEGTILDTDLQLLVNGLWQAGAEAVAVNGQRLTALSAIRTAGEAITVNFRSLSPPYVVSAVGDPDSLPARLLETPAGQGLVDLRSNFGIGFEIESGDDLKLPGGPQLGVRQAVPGPSRVGGPGAGP